MSERTRMTGVDTAWLRMDRPSNLMMISGVMIFKGRFGYDELRQVVRERFLKHRRFRMRPVRRKRGAYWENDPDFDLDYHVQRVALPGAADKVALEELVGNLVGVPLTAAKPLWQFHLVEKRV